MTDIVPYQQQRPGSMEIAGEAWKIAEKIADTELVPDKLRKRPEAVLAIMLAGHEAGVQPMQALQSIHIIEGRPAMSAQLMRALVLRQGHELNYDDVSTTSVTASGRRRGSERWTKVTWTMDDAKAARIDGKDNWKKWPRAMLIARATAELCRMIFADVLAGIPYTIEELTDGDKVDTGAVDFGPPEVVDPAAAPPKTARAAKAITKASQPDAPATLPPPARGDVPGLPGDDDEPSAEIAQESTSDPADVAETAEIAQNDDEPIEATATEDPPAADDEDWPSGEWPSDPDVEAKRARMSGAQVVAIRLRELFGIREKEDRRAAVVFLVGHEVTSSKDLTNDEVRALLDRLDSWPEGTPLYPVDPAAADSVATEPAASTVSDADWDDAREANGTGQPAADAAPAQNPTTEATSSPPQRNTPQPSSSSPETWTGDQWRKLLTERKVKVTAALPYAQRLASELVPPVSIPLLDDIAGSGVADALLGWVEDQSVGKAGK